MFQCATNLFAAVVRRFFTKPPEAAPGRFYNVEDNAKGGGFAASIWPQQPENTAFFHFKVELINCMNVAIIFGNSLNAENSVQIVRMFKIRKTYFVCS